MRETSTYRGCSISTAERLIKRLPERLKTCSVLLTLDTLSFTLNRKSEIVEGILLEY